MENHFLWCHSCWSSWTCKPSIPKRWNEKWKKRVSCYILKWQISYFKNAIAQWVKTHRDALKHAHEISFWSEFSVWSCPNHVYQMLYSLTTALYMSNLKNVIPPPSLYLPAASCQPTGWFVKWFFDTWLEMLSESGKPTASLLRSTLVMKQQE